MPPKKAVVIGGAVAGSVVVVAGVVTAVVLSIRKKASPTPSMGYACDGAGGVVFVEGGKCSAAETCKCWACSGKNCVPAAYNQDQTQTALYMTHAACTDVCKSYGCDGKGGVQTYTDGTGACTSRETCKCMKCINGTCQAAPINALQDDTTLFLSDQCSTSCKTYGCDGNGRPVAMDAGVGKCGSDAEGCKCWQCDKGKCTPVPLNARQDATNLFSSNMACTQACTTLGCDGKGGVASMPADTGACGTDQNGCKCWQCKDNACKPAEVNVSQSAPNLFLTAAACQPVCTRYGCDGSGSVVAMAGGKCGTTATGCKCWQCKNAQCVAADVNADQTAANLFLSSAQCATSPTSACNVPQNVTLPDISKSPNAPLSASPSFFMGQFTSSKQAILVSVAAFTVTVVLSSSTTMFMSPITVSVFLVNKRSLVALEIGRKTRTNTLTIIASVDSLTYYDLDWQVGDDIELRVSVSGIITATVSKVSISSATFSF